ncbi:MAG TPA: hypothetical protein VJ508_05570 [Saprospiraceae bacterium]|nr:hypothetical protein [Saprospiraceae bacterium]
MVNRKALIPVGILIAIAIATPIVALVTTLDNDIDDITFQGPSLADSSQLNSFIADIEADHSAVLIMVLVVEIICIALLAVTIWTAIK